MKLARDYKLHIAFGIAAAASSVLIVIVAERFGLPWAVFLAAALLGVGYEVQQRMRGEGEASWRDALATAAGGASVSIGMLIYSAARAL